jgi:hypothetical protein
MFLGARSKPWLYGRSLSMIPGSNPVGGAGGMAIFCGRCVFSVRGPCVGLIARPEESYQVCGCVCDQVQELLKKTHFSTQSS